MLDANHVESMGLLHYTRRNFWGNDNHTFRLFSDRIKSGRGIILKIKFLIKNKNENKKEKIRNVRLNTVHIYKLILKKHKSSSISYIYTLHPLLCPPSSSANNDSQICSMSPWIIYQLHFHLVWHMNNIWLRLLYMIQLYLQVQLYNTLLLLSHCLCRHLLFVAPAPDFANITQSTFFIWFMNVSYYII